MKLNRNLFLILSFLFASQSWALVQGSSKSYAQEIVETKKQMSSMDEKEQTALLALAQMNAKIKNLVFRKSKITSESSQIEVALESANEVIEGLEKSTAIQRQKVAKRLRVMSRWGSSASLGALFQSQNSANFEKNLKIIRQMVAADLKSLQDYKTSKLQLMKKKQWSSQRLARLNEKKNEISSSEKELKKEMDLKAEFIRNLRQSRKFTQEKIHRLQNQIPLPSGEDESFLKGLLQASFIEQRGELIVPVNGRIIQGFGVEKRHQYRLPHSGVFFETTPGTPVQNIFDGVVSFSGKLPGFGETVIVNHGDHFYSVYSFNQKVLVREGETLQKSQKLALSGFDPHRQKNGIYFEIRHYSEPDDPQAWMKGNTP